MIHQRRKAIQRRWDRTEWMAVWESDGRQMETEAQALKLEGVNVKRVRAADSDWGWEWRRLLSENKRKGYKDLARSQVRLLVSVR